MAKPIRVQNGSFVIYEDIPSKHPDYTFSRGTYCELNVIILNELGLIGASALCASFGRRKTGEPLKPLSEWLSTEAAKRKIEYYKGKLSEGSSSDGIMLKPTGLSNELRGVYMCKPLILLLASWLSDEFYDKIYSIIEHHAQKEAKFQLKTLNLALKKEKRLRLKEQEEAKVIIDTKTDKIDELSAELKKMRKLLKEQHEDIKDLVVGNKQLGGQISDLQEDLGITNETLLETNKALEDTTEALEETKGALLETNEVLEETKGALLETTEALEDTKEVLLETNEVLEETNQKLSLACSDRVLQLSIKGKHTTFILVRVERDKFYKVIRCQKAGVNLALSNKGFAHPDIAFQIDTTPNAMALWNKARESIPYLTARSNGGVIHGVTEDKFIEDIKAIHDNRYIVTLPSREEVLERMTKYQLAELMRRINIPINIQKTLKSHMIRTILAEEAKLAST